MQALLFETSTGGEDNKVLVFCKRCDVNVNCVCVNVGKKRNGVA